MLIFDSESFCIPAEESEVAEVYRSSASAEESLSSCEAFICVIARDQRNHVFAALHVTGVKRNLIYSVDSSVGEPSSESLKKAFAFVETMGFSMQAVNLKYGKAMREVVLRSIPVLLSPESIERIRNEKNAELSEMERLVSEAAAEETETGSTDSDPERQAEMKRARVERKNAASAAARKLAQEKSAAEQTMAVGEAVQKFLLQANASEAANVERAESERLRREISALEKRAAELAKALREARQEVEEEKDRGKDLAEGKKAAEKQVQELKKALSEARSKEESDTPAAAALMQAEERIARLEQAVCEARETAEAERFERELLVREKAAALRRLEELETERAGNEGASESAGQDPHDGGLEKRLAEAERAADQVRDQLEAERTERQRLEAEISQMEEALQSPPSRSDAAVDERVAGLRQALQRAEERTEILRLEVERLAAAKAAAEKRLSEREPASQKEAATPRSVGTAASPGSGDPVPPPHVVRRPPPKGAFFHADWDLSVVEYDSSEDILEVHESMNMAQLSLEGYHSQHCSAWIVGLKKGKVRQVHVAFGLSESARNLIYSPAKPIRNNDDYKRAMGEALKFLEVVGYLPEKTPLGKSPREQGHRLNGIPVLQGPQKRAQGF